MATIQVPVPTSTGTQQFYAEQQGGPTGPIALHQVPEVNGLPVTVTNPLPGQDIVNGAPVSAGNPKPVADANVGTVADAAWGGAGNASAIAVLKALFAQLAGTLKTSDANGAAFGGVVPITPGTPVAAGRSMGFICTTGGNITITYADASTSTFPIQASASRQTIPDAVTLLALGSGTAGTFWNLK